MLALAREPKPNEGTINDPDLSSAEPKRSPVFDEDQLDRLIEQIKAPGDVYEVGDRSS